MDRAVEVILKKGLAKSAKRAGAVAAEGLVATDIAVGGKSGVIVEVNIQTDFAARNTDFIAFVGKVVQAAKGAAAGADLGTLPFPGGSGSIEDARAALVGKLGENITVRRWQKLGVEGPGKVHSYVHMGGKIAVLLAVSTENDGLAEHAELNKFVDDTAMQVAAMSPQYLNPSGVDPAAKAQQSDIFAGQLKEEGKIPEEKWPRVIEGKVGKWMKEVCLLEQQSVLESDKSVDQVRAELEKAVGGSVKVLGFVRFECGEGVEKPQGPDFASEVAKMAAG
jgi:elongation factor Ts